MAGSFTIDAEFDASVTDSPYAADYEAAIETAIHDLEARITTPISVTIDFGYGLNPYDDSALPPDSGADSIGNSSAYTWTQLYDAVESKEKTSLVQRAAAALLTRDAAQYGSAVTSRLYSLTEAQVAALGLRWTGPSGADGWVGIATGDNDWNQNPGSSGADVVGEAEHEITEVLGRVDNLGAPNGDAGAYTLLDLFHYGSSNGAAGASPGSAAGALDEPFVSGYDSDDTSYFSYNGRTITWQYDTPVEVGQFDEDVADWSTAASTARGVAADSFDGAGDDGIVDPPLSQPDWEEMNVIGYDELLATYSVGQFLSERSTLDGSPFGFAIAGAATRIASNIAALGSDPNIFSLSASGGLVTVSTASFSADKAILDEVVGGFAISDTAANVVTNLNALVADPDIEEITLASGDASLTLGSGELVVTAALSSRATLTIVSGTLDLAGALDGKGTTVISGASELELGSTAGKRPTVEFTGADGELFLGHPHNFDSQIEGFDTIGTDDTIKIKGMTKRLVVDAGATSATLSFGDNGVRDSVLFVGDYVGSDFRLTVSGANTLLTYT